MLRLVADENFDGDILRGIVRRAPELDLVRVQDVGLAGADDPAVLAWAAREQRVLLTHDVETMTDFAYQRVDANLAMPGVVEISLDASVNQIIEDIILLAAASAEGEYEGRVFYLPL